MIDPDLIEAREIVKATLTPENHRGCNCRAEIDAGDWDQGQKVRAALAGIARGRVLLALENARSRPCRCAVCVSDLHHITPCLNKEA